jgi:flagellar biosynthetic protein FliR
LSLATVFDPTSNADSPVMSTFVQMIAMLMFLALNAHVFLLKAVANSYAWLPPGTELRWAGIADWGMKAVGGALVASVQLAGPVVLATICVDVVLGFVGKASPQLPVLLVGISVKAVVALAVLFVALRFWPDVIAKHVEAVIGATEKLFHVMR